MTFGAVLIIIDKQSLIIKQGWPNSSSGAACGSSNLHMWLIELSEKLCICFLFLLQSV